MGPTACTWRWALLVAGRKVQHSGRLARGRVSVEGAPMGLRKRGLGTEMGTVPGKAVSSSVFSLGPKGKFLLSDHAQALWAHSCQVCRARAKEVRVWCVLGGRVFREGLLRSS